MRNTRLAVRLCVIGAFALMALGLVSNFASPLPEALRNANCAHLAARRMDWWLVGLGAVFGVGFVVGGLGLLFPKRWAAPLALWSTLLSAAIYPFLNPAVVFSGWTMEYLHGSAMLWGAALALGYVSRSTSHFDDGR